MINKKTYMKELVDYIKKNLKKGYTKESLKWALINQGYSNFEVKKAIKKADEHLASKAPILKTKPIIKYEVIEPKENKVIYSSHKKTSFWDKIFKR